MDSKISRGIKTENPRLLIFQEWTLPPPLAEYAALQHDAAGGLLNSFG